ncbi:MAG: hypothetical protein JJT78_06930, partial [Leptospira sp.]|nr:hypothetical protein [Leptospira sp.]
ILTNRNPKCLFKNNESVFLGYGTYDNITLTSLITRLDLENKKEHIFYDTNIVRRNPNCLKIGESKYLILGY